MIEPDIHPTFKLLLGELGPDLLYRALGVGDDRDFFRITSNFRHYRGTPFHRKGCRLAQAEGILPLGDPAFSGAVGRPPLGGPFWQKLFARAGGTAEFLEEFLPIQNITLRKWVLGGIPDNSVHRVQEAATRLRLDDALFGRDRLRGKWFSVEDWRDEEPLRGVRALAALALREPFRK